MLHRRFAVRVTAPLRLGVAGQHHEDVGLLVSVDARLVAPAFALQRDFERRQIAIREHHDLRFEVFDGFLLDVEHDGPALEHDRGTQSFGKLAFAKGIVFIADAPLVLQDVEHHERVGMVVDADAVVTGLELGLFARVVEQGVKPFGFLVELRVTPVSAESDDRRRGNEADDEDHHHQLDEREAPAPGARGAHGITARDSSCQCRHSGLRHLPHHRPRKNKGRIPARACPGTHIDTACPRDRC